MQINFFFFNLMSTHEKIFLYSFVMHFIDYWYLILLCSWRNLLSSSAQDEFKWGNNVIIVFSFTLCIRAIVQCFCLTWTKLFIVIISLYISYRNSAKNVAVCISFIVLHSHFEQYTIQQHTHEHDIFGFFRRKIVFFSYFSPYIFP